MQFQWFLRSIFVVLLACMLSVSFNGEILHTFYGNQIECRCGEAGREGLSTVRVEVNVDEEFAVRLEWDEDLMGRYRYREASENVWVGSLAEAPHDGTGAGYIRGGMVIVIIRNEWDSDTYVYEDIITPFRTSKECVHSPQQDG